MLAMCQQWKFARAKVVPGGESLFENLFGIKNWTHSKYRVANFLHWDGLTANSTKPVCLTHSSRYDCVMSVSENILNAHIEHDLARTKAPLRHSAVVAAWVCLSAARECDPNEQIGAHTHLDYVPTHTLTSLEHHTAPPASIFMHIASS